MTRPFFERPTVKHLAITAMAFLLGAAVANGWATKDAMVGQAAWLHDQCGRTIKAKVQQHLKEDRDTFGFTPEDLRRPAK